MSRIWWITLPGSPEIVKNFGVGTYSPIRRPRILLFKGGESVIRLSLGRRLVNLLPVTQLTNAFTQHYSEIPYRGYTIICRTRGTTAVYQVRNSSYRGKETHGHQWMAEEDEAPLVTSFPTTYSGWFFRSNVLLHHARSSNLRPETTPKAASSRVHPQTMAWKFPPSPWPFYEQAFGDHAVQGIYLWKRRLPNNNVGTTNASSFHGI